MKAVVIRQFGDVSRLELENVTLPKAEVGEVTIDVAFSGVGLVDTLVRAGVFAFSALPLIPGIEVSGTIRTIGEGVTGFAVGQRVAALLTDFSDGGMGGYAEVVRAKSVLVVGLEPEDDLATAAATAVNGATAVLAMYGLERGSTVAISGASGGLGQCLIVAAANAGAAHIIAVSGNETRVPAMKRAGATAIVSPEAFAASEQPIDTAFDTVGGEMRSNLLRRLKPAGRLVLLGNASGQDELLPGDEIWLRSLKVEGLATGGLSPLFPERVSAAARAAIVNARTNPIAFHVLELEQVAKAHLVIEDRQGPGKLVLRVAR